jgi:hypothetical protein
MQAMSSSNAPESSATSRDRRRVVSSLDKREDNGFQVNSRERKKKGEAKKKRELTTLLLSHLKKNEKGKKRGRQKNVERGDLFFPRFLWVSPPSSWVKVKVRMKVQGKKQRHCHCHRKNADCY